ncbi:MAG: hypothetical protein KC503_12210 [Myxococcales bacterium]|nr:hypothetical protein [Myxococcales bacterium]
MGRDLRRRLTPWLALLVLALVSAAAQQRLEAATPAERGEDVADTHQRLDRIYKRLGIRQVKESKPTGGCNGDGEADAKKKKSKRSMLSGCGKMPAGFAYVLVGVIIVVMIVLIGMSLRSSYRDRGEPEQQPELEGEGEAQPAPSEPWRVDLDECRRLARAGDLAGAFAALHRCTLLTFEHQRHLVLDQATTNWAYVRQLVSKPELKRLLAAVTEAAERSVLGLAPPELSHFDKLEARVREEVLR